MEKDAAIAQLSFDEYQLCPDIPQYLINGRLKSSGSSALKFEVNLKTDSGLSQEQILEYVSGSVVYSSMINRYFSPTIYNKQGYMDFIAVTENKFSLVEGRSMQH